MPKRLFIIRHAKSDWKNTDWTSDFDRPLNDRGHKAAPEMGARLADKKIKPELMVSSPAVRAFTTAKYFAEAWDIKEGDIAIEPEIYEANIQILLSIINKFDNQYNSIAIFGHNPAFTDLANYLTDANIPNMPTASVVIVDFEIDDWAMVAGGTGDAALFDYPKSNRGD